LTTPPAYRYQIAVKPEATGRGVSLEATRRSRGRVVTISKPRKNFRAGPAGPLLARGPPEAASRRCLSMEQHLWAAWKKPFLPLHVCARDTGPAFREQIGHPALAEAHRGTHFRRTQSLEPGSARGPWEARHGALPVRAGGFMDWISGRALDCAGRGTVHRESFSAPGKNQRQPTLSTCASPAAHHLPRARRPARS